MKLTLTTSLKLDDTLDISITSAGDAYSDDWEDVRGNWLERHNRAMKTLSEYEIDLLKVVP